MEHFIVNSDETLNFNGKDWKCTDVDNFQYCHIINDHTFVYIQLRDQYVEQFNELFESGYDIEQLNGLTKQDQWLQEEIDVEDYTEDDIEEYISLYDYHRKDVDNQLIAECIFEVDVVSEDVYDVMEHYFNDNKNNK